ncbi:MAG: hypothetical protein KJ062_07630 [Thermoanaerobaculia bacterium]|nr:hypothetical protein [Thermoanaerobaculia bacterium]
MRITRPFVLLALAALLAPRIEASRTSVWESNPPASMTATKSDAAGLLAALAPAARLDASARADVETAEPPVFNLGDVILVDAADADAEHFDLGPLDLLGPAPLRGPPPSYPETRVRGFELLPPFRIGASPSLRLWPRQACGFVCREVVSDSRYDPWGLAVSVTKKGVMIASEELLHSPIEHFSWDWAAEHPDQFYALLTKRGGMNELEAGKLMADNGVMPGGQAGREFFVRQVSRDSRQLEDDATELWTSGMLGLGVDRALTATGRKIASKVAERQLAKEAAKAAAKESVAGVAGRASGAGVAPAAGAERAARFGANWQKASLSESVQRVAGPNPVIEVTASGKTIFRNPESGLQVVYDEAGNYFRVENPAAAGVGRYLDASGNVIPANVPLVKPTGTGQTGVPPEVRKALTHFSNSD